MREQRNRRVAIKLLVGLATLVATVGCQRPRNELLPKMYKVQGTVRCDGAPLANGRIVFEGADDAVLAIVPAAGAIIDGRYEADVYAGEKTVRIFSPVEVGEPDETGIPNTKETIAPAFNTKSTITVEVAPVEADAVDKNTFDFDVKSR